ncbi:MAG: hypothetical protein HZB55_17870, partial [Deltaproteobacteria bacterium]|nr:hypothetical protein [Deltaproteobacteria bacterium]
GLTVGGDEAQRNQVRAVMHASLVRPEPATPRASEMLLRPYAEQIRL